MDKDPRPLPALRRGIELRDAWFLYSERHPWVLKGVNLTIPHGSSTALVGLNGSGKTTLVKLLCRFYDPTRGVILWDGVDLREVDPAELRDRITAVFQDVVQYDLTAARRPESGVLLSGGQSQRLALARAFLRGTRDLMILDEPSARLDAKAEYETHTSIARHRRAGPAS